jgi:multidrug transporter EmrE-like cation transporter
MSLATIGALSLAETVGDFGFKAFARNGGTWAFTQGTVGYVVTIFFLIKSLKSGNLLYINGMWDGTSALLGSLAAYFILGERLTKPSEYLGLVLIIAGIFMLRATDGKIPF